MSVFWVDLRYKLCSRNEGSTARFLRMTGIHLILLLLLLLSTNSTGLVQRQASEAVVPSMYGTHLKYGQYLRPISFNNLGP